MGGIFSEGIDLKAKRLIGAIVVGPGLPQVCRERELLKNFYDARGEDGFFYAYLCPGFCLYSSVLMIRQFPVIYANFNTSERI